MLHLLPSPEFEEWVSGDQPSGEIARRTQKWSQYGDETIYRKTGPCWEFEGAQTSKTLKGQGARSITPFTHDLATSMNDVRRKEQSPYKKSTGSLPVWKHYEKELVQFEVDAPSVILLDNFDAHVSDDGIEVISETTFAFAEECLCTDGCICIVECKCDEVCVCGEGNEEQRQSLAPEKRRATIERVIRALEELSSVLIIKSFKKVIPKHPKVEV
ncbi:uncharacterized protein PITG_04439 [Phytophthora infestans T30-4]|uniref:DDE-1 domain-containing protein n=1 Tax=Phytophthora infestans (strain T30-4) TaxID=403677 RepID=D0N194_PHYIT|nr:uncharacterized protein PITG_04439 [Phytophthora infestans T30-4]EEY67407.1 hypothetical protein PITG_04439 [Phytophthora infestans T30-4]|eukprot:XP_002906055.1 hypothetical protein PITG_04439 [Phytophthora infestans T30-4]